jgi:hypothetical protein
LTQSAPHNSRSPEQPSAWQTPPEQAWPDGQDWLHPPQCAALVWVSTQALPHLTAPFVQPFGFFFFFFFLGFASDVGNRRWGRDD